MNILIMGPPGVGKGTQAQRLCADFNLAHFSTGDMLREHIANGTSLGATAQEYIKDGRLVPDDLIIEMVLERLATLQGGALLDGFPRTLEQAQALAAAKVVIDGVINLDAEDAVIVARLSGRLTHKASGRTYHIEFSPPKTPGVDDETGEPLIQREDDKAETVQARLGVYREQTAPLKEYYRRAAQAAQAGAPVYISVDGTQDINAVYDSIAVPLRDIQPPR